MITESLFAPRAAAESELPTQILPIESSAEHRERIVLCYPDELRIWKATSALFRQGIGTTRSFTSNLHLALDMLMLQGVNTHSSVALVAQHGLVEDGATLARRLLELSVQAVYIGGESDPDIRSEKVGRYLVYLWRSVPNDVRTRLPDRIREEWSSVEKSYGHLVPSTQKRWGPNWRNMFADCGIEDLYLSDYAFLSATAHGSYEGQTFRYSMSPIPMQDHRFLPHLLIYSSRYLASIGEHWNDCFDVIDTDELEALRIDLIAWNRS